VLLWRSPATGRRYRHAPCECADAGFQVRARRLLEPFDYAASKPTGLQLLKLSGCLLEQAEFPQPTKSFPGDQTVRPEFSDEAFSVVTGNGEQPIRSDSKPLREGAQPDFQVTSRCSFQPLDTVSKDSGHPTSFWAQSSAAPMNPFDRWRAVFWTILLE